MEVNDYDPGKYEQVQAHEYNVKRAVESKRRDILTKYKEANMLLHEE